MIFQALDGFLLMITQVLKHHSKPLCHFIIISQINHNQKSTKTITKHDNVQTGRILYISENAAEYLGHSMEDLLIHGDRLSINISISISIISMEDLLINTFSPTPTPTSASTPSSPASLSVPSASAGLRPSHPRRQVVSPSSST